MATTIEYLAQIHPITTFSQKKHIKLCLYFLMSYKPLDEAIALAK